MPQTPIFHAVLLFLASSRVCVIHRHWPIVLGDAGPEDPYSDDREEGEQGFEHRSIDFAVSSITDMDTDHVVEDLSNGEQESCRKQVNHGFPLAQNSNYQHRLQYEEDEQEDQRGQLIEDVEGDISVVTT